MYLAAQEEVDPTLVIAPVKFDKRAHLSVEGLFWVVKGFFLTCTLRHRRRWV